MNAEIMALLDSHKAFNKSRGMDVRCPVCHVGIQQWCMDITKSDGYKTPKRNEDWGLYGADGRRASHPERLKAAGVA